MPVPRGREDGEGRVGELPAWVDDGTRLAAGERRLVALMEEFRRRQRRCPDLVVRPWWTPAAGPGTRGRVGFVVEYCPDGRSSVELAVRRRRLTVDGPGGATDAALDLDAGWMLDGLDTRSPETLANHLLRLADRALGEAA